MSQKLKHGYPFNQYVKHDSKFKKSYNCIKINFRTSIGGISPLKKAKSGKRHEDNLIALSFVK